MDKVKKLMTLNTFFKCFRSWSCDVRCATISTSYTCKHVRWSHYYDVAWAPGPEKWCRSGSHSDPFTFCSSKDNDAATVTLHEIFSSWPLPAMMIPISTRLRKLGDAIKITVTQFWKCIRTVCFHDMDYVDLDQDPAFWHVLFDSFNMRYITLDNFSRRNTVSILTDSESGFIRAARMRIRGCIQNWVDMKVDFFLFREIGIYYEIKIYFAKCCK
jgi:hypothetical protein